MDIDKIEIKQVNEKEFLIGYEGTYPMQIKQISDDEYWIGNKESFPGDVNAPSITFAMRGNLQDIEVIGESNEYSAKGVEKVAEIFDNKIAEKVNIITNLNKAGFTSAGARKLWIRMGNREKANKVALYGLPMVASVLSAFVINAIGKRPNIQFFKTREEALAWINK